MSAMLQLITIMCDKPNAMHDVLRAGITGAFFAGESREVFEFVTNYAAKYGQPPSHERVQEQFPNFRFEKPRSVVSDLIARTMKEAQRQFLSAKLLEIGRRLGNDDDAAIDMFISASTELSSLMPATSVSRFSDAKNRYDDYQRRVKAGETPFGIKLGIEPIDEATLGINNGDYVIIVGRLGTGKSTLLQKLALEFWRQKKTALIVSLEMKGQAVLSRIDAMLSKTSYYTMRRQALSTRQQQQWRKTIDRISGDHDIIVVDNVPFPNPSAISRFIDVYHPDVVAIDNLTLMTTNKTDGRSFASWERMMVISRSLKQIGMTKNLPIIALTQASRKAAEEGVNTENIGYSDAIGQDADIGIGIEPIGDDENTRLLRILKNRDLHLLRNVVTEFDENTMEFTVRSVEDVK